LDLGKIWAKMIRFGQNQNLASPKTFDILCTLVIRFIWVGPTKHRKEYKEANLFQNTRI